MRSGRFPLQLSLLLVIFFTTEACQRDLDNKPNIILLVPDALRAKQLPAYGYTSLRTPHVDALVKDSVKFERCLVKTPATTESFSNLFSGRLFPSVGLMENEKLLAEYLMENGYYNVGIVSSRVLWSPEHHEKGGMKNQFRRGFHEYLQDVSLTAFPYHRKNKDTTSDVLAWLRNRKKNQTPFFLFVHYMDPHAPLEPSYDGEIEKIDFEIGKIFELLKEQGLYDDALIVFTSDHGEALKNPLLNHGSPRGHGWFLYMEQVHVPLIMKFPDNQYIKSVGGTVRNYDLMPTILDYLGADYEKGSLDGVSLLPSVKKDEDLNLVSYHLSGSNRVCPEGSHGVVFKYRDDVYQLIEGMFSNTYRELYNIAEDPDAKNNLSHERNYFEVLDHGESLLRDMRLRMPAPRKAAELANEELEALRTLGYVAGGAPAPRVMSRGFLMQKELGQAATITYHGIIRQLRWGTRLRDRYYPVKILSMDDGDAFILANKNREIVKYSFKNGFETLGEEKVVDMALDAESGKLYLLTAEGIRVLETDSLLAGEHTTINTAVAAVAGSIRLDHDGNLLLLENGKLTKLDQEGGVLEVHQLEGSSNPTSLTVDDEGNKFLAVRKNKVLKIDRNGEVVAVLHPGGVDEIAALATDSGRLWILEKNSPRVFIVDDEFGEVLASFTYNTTRINKRRNSWLPVPTKDIHLNRKRLYIIDNWEGILVYSVSRN